MSADRIAAVNDHGMVIGQDHHRAKLTDHEVDLVTELRAGGMTLVEIGLKFEISKGMAHDLCSGRRRSHVAMGQKLLRPAPPRLRFRPARIDEFDVCVTLSAGKEGGGLPFICLGLA